MYEHILTNQTFNRNAISLESLFSSSWPNHIMKHKSLIYFWLGYYAYRFIGYSETHDMLDLRNIHSDKS